MRKNNNHKDGANPAEGVAVIIENQIAGEGKSVKRHTSLNQTVIVSAVCVVLTYLSTSFLLFNYGSFFWGSGDSNHGLQKQLKELKESEFRCESSEKLAEAKLRIIELENEKNILTKQRNEHVFKHIQSVGSMSLKQRASLRSDYAKWEKLRDNWEKK